MMNTEDGVAKVKANGIEIEYETAGNKSDPALLLVMGPLFPDAVMWLHRRRWQRKLDSLVGDLGRASETLETYRPLSELTRALELPEEPAYEAPAVPARERG